MTRPAYRVLLAPSTQMVDSKKKAGVRISPAFYYLLNIQIISTIVLTTIENISPPCVDQARIS